MHDALLSRTAVCFGVQAWILRCPFPGGAEIKQLAQRAVQRAKRSVGPTGACAGARAQRGRRLGGGRADGANYSNGALRGPGFHGPGREHVLPRESPAGRASPPYAAACMQDAANFILCATALLPTVAARTASSGALCRTDQNAGASPPPSS